jgi:hypothetical protein
MRSAFRQSKRLKIFGRRSEWAVEINKWHRTTKWNWIFHALGPKDQWEDFGSEWPNPAVGQRSSGLRTAPSAIVAAVSVKVWQILLPGGKPQRGWCQSQHF